MPFLLSNNFEQIVGCLTVAECKLIIEAVNGIDADDILPEQPKLRLPSLLSSLEETEQLASAYTAWEAHRAAWTSDPATYLGHGVTDPDRLAALLRGENLYTPNDVAYTSTNRQFTWLVPTTPRTGWQYMPILFWSGSTPVWAMTSTGGTQTTYAGAAAQINAMPDGQRYVRVNTFPLWPAHTLPGGEKIVGWMDGHFSGTWAGLRWDQVWLPKMLAVWEPWLAGMLAAGADLEGLLYDHEVALGYWWIKNSSPTASNTGARMYAYHPNYPPGTGSLEDLIDNPDYDDTFIEETFHLTRAEWNNMESWTSGGIEETKFNAGAHHISRRQVKAINDAARAVFTNIKGLDYEDTLNPGNVYPSRRSSLGTGLTSDDEFQSRNIYSGASENNNTKSSCFFPGIGVVSVARKSVVRVTPTGVTSGSSLQTVLEDYPYYWPDPGAGVPDNYNFSEITVSVTSTGETMYALSQKFANEWNRERFRLYPYRAEEGDQFKITFVSPAFTLTHTVLAGSASAFAVAQALATLWNASSGHTLLDEAVATAVDLGSGNGYVSVVGNTGFTGWYSAWTNNVVPSVVNFGGSLTPAFYKAYDRYQQYAMLATAVDAGGGNGYVSFQARSNTLQWHHKIEDIVAQVVGTGSAAVSITERGSFTRMQDEWFLMSSMAAASSMPQNTWLMPYDDALFNPFGKASTRRFHKLALYYQGPWGILWNSTTTDLGEDEFVSMMAEYDAEVNSIVGTVLPLPVRAGYTTDPLRAEKFAEGRIIVHELNSDGTETTHYQPAITPIGDKAATVGEELTFTVVATDDDAGETLTYSMTGAPAGATLDPDTGEFAWTPEAGDEGDHELTIWVQDDGPDTLTNGEHITIAVTPSSGNTKPYYTAGHDDGVLEAYRHVIFHHTMVADDLEADNITFSIVAAGSPAGVTIDSSTGVISWTPTAIGVYLITVKITDDGVPPLSEQVGIYVKVNEMPIVVSGQIGPNAGPLYATTLASGVGQYAMSALHTGAAMIFRAPDARDIKSIWLYWSAVASPGQVAVEVQTLTNGLPVGNLYDANAQKLAVVPTLGWQNIQFATLPTTGLTAGTYYAVVIRTTTAGTTQSLGYWSFAQYPAALLTDADVNAGYNFANAANCCCAGTLVLEDDTEVSLELKWVPSGSFTSADQIYDDRWAGNQFILDAPLYAEGIQTARVVPNASPGNCYFEIRDEAFSVVSGAQSIVPVGRFVSGSLMNVHFSEPVLLKPGKYFAGIWQGNKSGDGDSTNRYQIDRGAIVRASTLLSGKYLRAFTTDVDSGAPTPDTDRVLPISILAAGLSAPPLLSRSMRGVNQL